MLVYADSLQCCPDVYLAEGKAMGSVYYKEMRNSYQLLLHLTEQLPKSC